MKLKDVLPGRPKGAHNKDGYVYIVEFTDGTLKVGRANDLRVRLSRHLGDAEKFNLSIARWWGSPLHRNYASNEKKLIDFAVGEGERSGGREYFTGVSFSAIRSFASSLPMSPTSPGLAAAEIKSDEERDKAFIAHLFPEPEYRQVRVYEEVAANALELFFDESARLPAKSKGLSDEVEHQVHSLVDVISSAAGTTADEVIKWSTFDWMCHLLDEVVNIAKLKMRERIAAEGRHDLYERSLGRSSSQGGEVS